MTEAASVCDFGMSAYECWKMPLIRALNRENKSKHSICPKSSDHVMKIENILTCNDQFNFSSHNLIKTYSNHAKSDYKHGKIQNLKSHQVRPHKVLDLLSYPKCNICLKTFSRPSSLKTHSYTHTGEKPVGCSTPNCGMRFNVISNLRRHTKKCRSDNDIVHE